MKSFWTVVTGNLPWCVAILIATGTLVTTIKFQGENIKANDAADLEAHKLAFNRIADDEKSLEKTLVRLENIQNDIRDIKEDIKEIKKIVLRPIIGQQSRNEIPGLVAFYTNTSLYADLESIDKILKR